MMSAKGQVMYYSNASETGEVPTGDCISMNSKKGDLGVGGGWVQRTAVLPDLRKQGRKKGRRKKKS